MLKLLAFSLFFAVNVKAEVLNFPAWIKRQETLSLERMKKNISPVGTTKGTVVASPSQFDPDYCYHWVRDAALIMNVIVNEVMESSDLTTHPNFRLITDYIKFTDKIQASYALTGLGEPKYLVDGNSFMGPWGRPQNDGPALRAYSLSKLAIRLIADGKIDLVKEKLYRATIPADSVIKRDLEYVAHHWTESSFDLWEEVKGQHFYTLMAIRNALVVGAKLALQMNDKGAADFYTLEGLKVEEALKAFTAGEFILTTLNRVEGANYKDSNLDIAPVLAVIHGEETSLIPVTHKAVQGTIDRLEKAFHNLYPINQRKLPGTLFGRYPEDQYYNGNPWILCTLAVAETYYKKAQQLHNSKFFDKGEELLKRLQYHATEDGNFSEQFHKNSGYMLGAVDLTWSHASFLTTVKARNRALLSMKKTK
ncbi:MAG: glycoside hydrolase family 15 protein [Bacteriovoracaceae bacterium]